AGATSKAAVTALATPRTSGRIAVRKGSGRWKGSAVLTNDKFFEPKLVFDRKGRRHVAGRGGAYHDVFYAGPSGKRRVFASAWGGGAGLAIDAKNRPVVGYGDSEARTVNGLIVFCPRFRTQTATAKHKTLRALPDGGDGFEYTELASDPRGGPVHTAYSIGEQLHYHRMGAKPLKLPVSRTRVLRVAVGGGVVAVGSLTDRGVLTVFHRKGTSGAFSKRSLGNGVTHYDLAVGRDGVPRVAFARKGRLHVFNGRKVVASAIPAFRVGIGVDRDRRVHVVFSPADHPNCRGSVVAVWCTNRNGVYHLRLDRGAARGTWTRVQPTVGYSPARYSVATTGRTVAVAYGNPANRVALTVRSRRF
ncbi:MAG TPA: hypothetical protein VM307_04935, partial [Egibacteraceae bacterium]|nr:hypothetical protein [Egibacteraceae bacterium]